VIKLVQVKQQQQELISIIDEMIGAAASMHTGPQNYDTFIKTREVCIRKISQYLEYNSKLVKAIESLQDNLVSIN
jgi:hypothetical protein